MKDLLRTLSMMALIGAAGPALAQSGDAATDAPADTQAPLDDGAADGGAADGGATQDDAPAADGIEAGPGDLSMGEDAAAPVADGEPQPGQTYVKEEHGDWDVRCVRTENDEDPCQLYQLLTDPDGNPVAEFSMFGLPEGQQAAAGANIITPLETLLTQQLTLQVDTGQSRRYPFTFCAANGCFARVGFTDDEVSAFKRGRNAVLTIVPAAAPDQQIKLDVSLSGFTAGFDAVNAANGN